MQFITKYFLILNQLVLASKTALFLALTEEQNRLEQSLLSLYYGGTTEFIFYRIWSLLHTRKSFILIFNFISHELLAQPLESAGRSQCTYWARLLYIICKAIICRLLNGSFVCVCTCWVVSETDQFYLWKIQSRLTFKCSNSILQSQIT